MQVGHHILLLILWHRLDQPAGTLSQSDVARRHRGDERVLNGRNSAEMLAEKPLEQVGQALARDVGGGETPRNAPCFLLCKFSELILA